MKVSEMYRNNQQDATV